MFFFAHRSTVEEEKSSGRIEMVSNPSAFVLQGLDAPEKMIFDSPVPVAAKRSNRFSPIGEASR